MKHSGPPRKAFLLAAGFGTRISPLSFDLPKPVMPLWGKPAIGHIIDMLAEWGVRDFMVNLHHEPSPILSYLKQRAGTEGIRINLSFEPTILETGGALRRAEWFFDDSPFWLVNTDIAASATPVPFLRHLESDTVAVLWMHGEKGPRTVEMSDDTIRNFASSRPGKPGTFTFCGLHLLKPDILNYIPEKGPSSIISAYRLAMKDGKRVAGITIPGAYWSDMGTPDSYLRTHAETWSRKEFLDKARRVGNGRRLRKLKTNGLTFDGVVAVGKGVTAAAGARIRDSVVWDGADIGPRAKLNQAIVGRGVHVNRPLTGTVLNAAVLEGEDNLGYVISQLGWAQKDTSLQLLSARGSDRGFARLAKRNSTAILIRYGTERPENKRYAGHSRFLRDERIPVPDVILDLPGRRTTVVEDVGDVSLENRAGGLSKKNLKRHYEAVLEVLLRMQAIDDSALSGIRLERPFSRSLYEWEHDLFAEHLLRKRLRPGTARVRSIMENLRTVSRPLVDSPKVLVHRDMQSSNILLRRGRPVLIDFQGMRMGSPAYDLASLLCDPYVMLPESMLSDLLEFYINHSRMATVVRDTFWPAAVQRLAQALGAFGRLSSSPGTRRFERYIPPALERMRLALSHMDGMPHLKEVVEELRQS
ncbi:MAG: phosphotransferase [Kiritimatiellia bacterium]|jgi:hypothetical protein|nr:phosphotransferase [Kiritimatiellia bacterium]MDP6847849.1 phosphotransferase [Kiritimatiellia bacterium]